MFLRIVPACLLVVMVCFSTQVSASDALADSAPVIVSNGLPWLNQSNKSVIPLIAGDKTLPAYPTNSLSIICANRMNAAWNAQLSQSFPRTYRTVDDLDVQFSIANIGYLVTGYPRFEAVNTQNVASPLTVSAESTTPQSAVFHVTGWALLPDSAIYETGTLNRIGTAGVYRIRATLLDVEGNQSVQEFGYIWIKKTSPVMNLAKLIRKDTPANLYADAELAVNPSGSYSFGCINLIATEPGVIGGSWSTETIPNIPLIQVDFCQDAMMSSSGNPTFWTSGGKPFIQSNYYADIDVIDSAGNRAVIGRIEKTDLQWPTPPPIGVPSFFAFQPIPVVPPANVVSPLLMPLPTGDRNLDLQPFAGRYETVPFSAPNDEVDCGGLIQVDANYQRVFLNTGSGVPSGYVIPLTALVTLPDLQMVTDIPGQAVYDGNAFFSSRQFGPKNISSVGPISGSGPTYAFGYPNIFTLANEHFVNPVCGIFLSSPLEPMMVVAPPSWNPSRNQTYTSRRSDGVTTYISTYSNTYSRDVPLPVHSGSTSPTIHTTYTSGWDRSKSLMFANFRQGWLRPYSQSGSGMLADVYAPIDINCVQYASIPFSRESLRGGSARMTSGLLGVNENNTASRPMPPEILASSAGTGTTLLPSGAGLPDSTMDLINRTGYRSLHIMKVDTDVLGVGKQTLRITGEFGELYRNTWVPPLPISYTTTFGPVNAKFYRPGNPHTLVDTIQASQPRFESDPTNKSMGQTLVMDLDIDPSAAGIYDIEFQLAKGPSTYGNEDGWLDTLVKLPSSLAIVSLTPRQMTSTGAIQPLANDQVTTSASSPTISISSYTFIPDSTQAAATEQVSGTFILNGTVKSWVCDVTPGAQGIIDTVSLYLNDQSTALSQISLTTSKTTGIAPQKYPYAGNFTANVRASVLPGLNQLSVRATDKVYKKTGTSEVNVEVRRNGSGDPDATHPGSGGIIHIEYPFLANLDLSTVDLAAVAAGTASLPLTVQSQIDPLAPVISDTLTAMLSSPSVMRGKKASLTVDPALLVQAQAGTITTFTAEVDAPDITAESRTVTFRKLIDGTYASDVWQMQITTPTGLDGSGSITVTVQRGAQGPVQTATLTKTGDVWSSSDASMSLTLVATTGADGSEGITAVVTSPSIEANAVMIQAVRSAPGPSPAGPPMALSSSDMAASVAPQSASSDTTGVFSTGNIRGAVFAYDQQDAPARTLRPAATTTQHSGAEFFNPLVIEVAGPPEIIGQANFRLPTASGDRPIVQVNGVWYLATADGAAPETMLMVGRDQPTGGGAGEEPTTDPGDATVKNGLPWYVAGFGMGFGSGGLNLVTGLGEIVYTGIKVGGSPIYLTANYELSFFPGSVGQAAQQRFDGRIQYLKTQGDIAALPTFQWVSSFRSHVQSATEEHNGNSKRFSVTVSTPSSLYGHDDRIHALQRAAGNGVLTVGDNIIEA